MNNKAMIPVAAVAIVALIGLLIWWGKKNFSGPDGVTTKEAGLPPFIDPATNRPWAPGKGPNQGGPGNAGGATTGEAPKGRAGSMQRNVR